MAENKLKTPILPNQWKGHFLKKKYAIFIFDWMTNWSWRPAKGDWKKKVDFEVIFCRGKNEILVCELDSEKKASER